MEGANCSGSAGVSSMGAGATLKTALARSLGTQCHSQKWLGGGNRRNAFVDFELRKPPVMIRTSRTSELEYYS